MWTLGLNAPPLGWHDSSAALVGPDGDVIALVEEERPSRVKHGLHRYPHQAISECLDIAGIHIDDISVVAIGWDVPRQWPRTDADKLDPPLPGRLWQFDDWNEYLVACLGRTLGHRKPDLVFVPHHKAHAVSTFYGSGWDAAAILVADGNGDDEAISIFEGSFRDGVRRVARLPVTQSLGYMYDAVSELLGLTFLEAGKTMGLASYGRGAPARWPMFNLEGDEHCTPFELPSSASYDDIVGAWKAHLTTCGVRPITAPAGDLAEIAEAVDLAWSAQHSLEVVISRLAALARRLTGQDRLCIAGGVGLNCSANGRLPEPIYVPPITHDAGIALGAAWAARPPVCRSVLNPYLGSATTDLEVAAAAREAGLECRPVQMAKLAERISAGEVGAIFAGRAEAGPRALCHRSIIASPAERSAHDKVNRLKSRELWRPLSPVGLPEAEQLYWTPAEHLHRYMLGAAEVTDRCIAEAPAVVHVDRTARPQIVSESTEPVHQLLTELKGLGHPPVLMNTSFNGRGEPIVNSPIEAIRCASKMGLGFVVFDEQLVSMPA